MVGGQWSVVSGRRLPVVQIITINTVNVGYSIIRLPKAPPVAQNVINIRDITNNL